jgi:CheY-like chemotaxis protein
MNNPQLYAIICIDDDPIILNVLDFQLRKQIQNDQIIFEYFTNPEIAVTEILQMTEKGVTPIILITDYQMPQITGAKVIRDVKQKLRNLKCIMLSGQANAIQVDDLVNEELLTAFIPKPWSESELFATLLNILEEKNLLVIK